MRSTCGSGCGSGSVVANARKSPHSGATGPLGSAAIDAAPGAIDLTCAAPAGQAELLPWYVVPDGGLALWCKLPGNWSSALVACARTRGILLVPGAAFAVDGVGLERYLRLPFALGAGHLERAVRAIAEAGVQLGDHEPAPGRRGARRPPPPAVLA